MINRIGEPASARSEVMCRVGVWLFTEWGDKTNVKKYTYGTESKRSCKYNRFE